MAFKEICPAGPGYQYSASTLQFNQRITEQLGNNGALLVTHGNQDYRGTSNTPSPLYVVKFSSCFLETVGRTGGLLQFEKSLRSLHLQFNVSEAGPGS